jgi:cellobiose-specific phosphotransferase system component IIC
MHRGKVNVQVPQYVNESFPNVVVVVIIVVVVVVVAVALAFFMHRINYTLVQLSSKVYDGI